MSFSPYVLSLSFPGFYFLRSWLELLLFLISLGKKIHLRCFLITNVDVDETSKRRYSEKLSYVEDGLLSAYSPSPCDMGGTRLHGTSLQATRVVRHLSRQSTEGSLEMETAFNNRGFEDSYATDSSSVWSPEASYFCLFSPCLSVGSPWLTLYPLQLPPPSRHNLSKKGIFLWKTKT